LSKQQKEEVAGIIRNKQKQLMIVKEELNYCEPLTVLSGERIELRREGIAKKQLKRLLI
jgi:hypothetical protein